MFHHACLIALLWNFSKAEHGQELVAGRILTIHEAWNQKEKEPESLYNLQ